VVEELEPVYQEFSGWEEDLSGVREFSELPGSAQDYLKMIQDQLEVPLMAISVGKEREQIILLKEPF